MRNSPVGARFLTASKQYVIKPLSKNITAAFRLLYKSVEKYHNQTNFIPDSTHFG